MTYRLATPEDIDRIVDLHYDTKEALPDGIFTQLGKPFLKRYYEIIMKDPNAVIICAVDDTNKVQGFDSGNLDVGNEFKNLKKHKVSLGIAALKSIIRHPHLLSGLIKRYKSIGNHDTGQKFVSTSGARGEYMAWDKYNNDAIAVLEMREAFRTELTNRGVKEYFIEVDTSNKSVFKMHQLDGAEVLEIFKLPDGRERAVMKYDLAKIKKRFTK
jgi:hypothetical protein